MVFIKIKEDKKKDFKMISSQITIKLCEHHNSAVKTATTKPLNLKV